MLRCQNWLCLRPPCIHGPFHRGALCPNVSMNGGQPTEQGSQTAPRAQAQAPKRTFYAENIQEKKYIWKKSKNESCKRKKEDSESTAQQRSPRAHFTTEATRRSRSSPNSCYSFLKNHLCKNTNLKEFCFPLPLPTSPYVD